MPQFVENNKNYVTSFVGMLVSIGVFLIACFFKDLINGPLTLIFPLSIFSATFFVGYYSGGPKKGLFSLLGFLVFFILIIIIALIIRYFKFHNICVF